MKNRTHYSIENITTLVDEKVVNYTAEFTASLGNNINLIDGEKYCLICNGVEYESVAALDSSGWMYVFFDTEDGIRLQLSISSNDVEHALWFDCYNKESQELITGTYTIKVFTRAEEIHHLDPKYIKDMYYVKDEPVYTPLEENLSVSFLNYGVYQYDLDLSFIEGNVYAVLWNEVPYECVAWMDSYGNINLGNGKIIYDMYGVILSGPEFDVPFFINDGYVYFYGTGSDTLSIT